MVLCEDYLPYKQESNRMTGTLRKVKLGDPLATPAATFNTFIDAARDYQQRAQNSGRKAQPGFRQSGIVRVKNGSGTDCRRLIQCLSFRHESN